MSNVVKIAFHLVTKKIIHIDNASNGISCNCVCLKCNESLEAIQGDIRTKHFRHYSKSNCEGSQETALHELGKQILIENSEISIPKYGKIKYLNAKAEKEIDSIRPDVSAFMGEEEIFFEIFVTHAVENVKESFFIEKRYKSVEINLSYCLGNSFEEIKKLVLEETTNKKVIYWENEVVVEKEKQRKQTNNHSWVVKLLAGILGVLICIRLIGLFKKRKYAFTSIHKQRRNYFH